MNGTKLAKRRLLGTAVVVLSLMAAAILAIDWYQGMREFRQWQRAIPLAAEIDIARPGETIASFRHTCPNPHATYLYMVAGEDVDGSFDVDQFFQMMDGFSGQIEILDQDGKTLASQEFNRHTAMSWDQGEYIVTKLPRVPPGDYRVRILVTDPASPGDASIEDANIGVGPGKDEAVYRDDVDDGDVGGGDIDPGDTNAGEIDFGDDDAGDDDAADDDAADDDAADVDAGDDDAGDDSVGDVDSGQLAAGAELGSVELSEMSVRLEARYFLCGMEVLPAILYGAGAIASLLIGLVVACFTLPYVWRYGFTWSSLDRSTDQ